VSTQASNNLSKQAYRHQAKTSLSTVGVTSHESAITIASMTDDCSRLIELVFVCANVLANDWCAQHRKGH